MTAIPAITLWQPWASLIAEGVKTIETRSWRAPADVIGERIAIHAAKRKPRTVFESANGGGLPEWFPADISDRTSLYGRGEETADGWWFAHQWTGPLGAVVATATLTACLPMVPWNDPQQRNGEHRLFVGPDELWQTQERGPARNISDQLPYGDFAPGRWAWMLNDIASVAERCPWCWRGERLHPCDCPVCGGDAACEPAPARGRQRVWRWEP